MWKKKEREIGKEKEKDKEKVKRLSSYRPTALLSKYGVLNEAHNRSSDDQIHKSTLNIDENGQRLKENSWVKYVVQTNGNNEMINKITGE